MDELPDDLDLSDEQRRLLLEMTPDERRRAIDYTYRVRKFERDTKATFRKAGAGLNGIAMTLREELGQPYNQSEKAQEHGLNLVTYTALLSESAYAVARGEFDVAAQHQEAAGRYRAGHDG